MEEIVLEKGQVFYGLALGGNHGQNCLFESIGDLFMAFFDEIYLRDILGEVRIDFPSNTNYSQRFRFENSLKITEYRTVDNDVEVTIKEGSLKIPFWVREKEELALKFPTFDEWLASLSLRELYRTEEKVKLFDFSGNREKLWITQAYRIRSACTLKFYYDMLYRKRSFQDMKSLFINRLNLSEEERIDNYGEDHLLEIDIKPLLTYQEGNEDSPKVQELIKMMEKKVPVKELYRFASLHIDTYKYVQSDDFYHALWSRDLPVFYDYEAAFPEFYSPLMDYSWNYNRLLDLKTFMGWIKTRQSLSDSSLLEKEKHLYRFDLQELKKMPYISMLDPCYQLRLTFDAKRNSDRLKIISNQSSFIKSLKEQFINFEDLWARKGYKPKTAVPDPTILELDLSRPESILFLQTVVNFLVREYKMTAFRFG